VSLDPLRSPLVGIRDRISLALMCLFKCVLSRFRDMVAILTHPAGSAPSFTIRQFVDRFR
jgi:hypothetical protein